MFRVMMLGNMHKQLLTASEMAIKRGAKVLHVPDINAAMNALRNGKGADIILAEVQYDISQLIARLQEERIVIPVVACGIGQDKEKAVAAIKAGAKEYIPLPPDEDMIAAVLEAICSSGNETKMIGQSPAFIKSVNIAKHVASSEASVLITGESGTGKEGIAQLLHKHSNRKDKPWIALNCGAIPENLIESEMFGHEKGSFTGAIERRKGKFEEAEGGTIFLDEIGEMPLHLQVTLLRAIQEKEITRIGSSKPVSVNVRIVAASNKNLLEMVQQGKFRADLFYRLNVISIHLPPLRERQEDIALLAEYFIAKYAEINGVTKKDLSEGVLEKLMSYTWPGNIRELENTMHRSLLLENSSNITTSSIEFISASNSNMEDEMVKKALSFCQGDYNKAAHVLTTSLKVIKRKLNQLTG